MCGRDAAREMNGVDTHDSRNVLERMFTEVDKPQLELVDYLVAHFRRHANSAWLRNALEARGDVDAIAVDSRFVMNHVTEVDADTKLHTSTLGHVIVAAEHDNLDLDGTFNGVNHAREFS